MINHHAHEGGTKGGEPQTKRAFSGSLAVRLLKGRRRAMHGAQLRLAQLHLQNEWPLPLSHLSDRLRLKFMVGASRFLLSNILAFNDKLPFCDFLF